MQRLLIIALIVVAFAAFMVTYTVRFTEKAVVTTFGRADDGSVKAAPGLYFKFPYVQQVTKYDSRARYLESNQETQQTADSQQILATAYMTWRVEDPLKFFRKFSASGDLARDHYREAEKVLRTKLRSAMGEVSRFQFGQLLAADGAESQLPTLEENILRSLGQASGADGDLADFGVVATSVGISRIGLPQNTTRVVFETMNTQRKLIADEAINQGQAQADSIRSGADSDARKITTFAERLASEIRNQGEIEAAQFIKQLEAQPKLAVFIRNMEFLKEAFGSTTTLVLPTSMPGLNFMKPDALANLEPGDVPGPDLSGLETEQKAATPPAKPPAALPTPVPVSAAPAPAGPAGSGGSR